VSAISTFVSAFVIAFTRQWKFALILSCILPTMLLIFGVGGGTMARLAKKVVAEYSAAATIAEEVLSSIRTAQAFGTEEKLAKEYDESLEVAQKVGYKKAAAMAMMFAGIFTLVYRAYGLAFCTFPPLIHPPCAVGLMFRGRITIDCVGRVECRSCDERFVCGHYWLVLPESDRTPN